MASSSSGRGTLPNRNSRPQLLDGPPSMDQTCGAGLFGLLSPCALRPNQLPESRESVIMFLGVQCFIAKLQGCDLTHRWTLHETNLPAPRWRPTFAPHQVVDRKPKRAPLYCGCMPLLTQKSRLLRRRAARSFLIRP